MTQRFPGTAPAEAIDHFRAKGWAIGFHWQDVWGEEHQRAFTVAGAMHQDVLADIREAVDRAIANGETVEEFRQNLEPKLAQRGWTGRQRVTDPATGDTVLKELGTPRRLALIFDANLRSAYAAGRWERIERRAETRPWLRYSATLDDRTRPDHAAWHGTTLPVDDPFWAEHYPPNGWRCRCTVQQLSDADLRRRNITPDPSPPVRRRRHVNKRTGEVEDIPTGVDPGWHTHVARSRDQVLASASARSRARAAEVFGARPPSPNRWGSTHPAEGPRHDRAFAQAPADVARAIANTPPLNRVTTNAVRTQYYPGRHTIALSADDSLDFARGRTAWRHETAHAVSHGGGTRPASRAAARTMATEGDRLAAREVAAQAAVAEDMAGFLRQLGRADSTDRDRLLARWYRREGISYSAIRPLLRDQADPDRLHAQAARYLAAVRRGSAVEATGALARSRELDMVEDFLGAVTSNRIALPAGHSTNYYRGSPAVHGMITERHAEEAFADWFGLKGGNRVGEIELLRKLAPETTRELDAILKALALKAPINGP